MISRENARFINWALVTLLAVVTAQLLYLFGREFSPTAYFTPLLSLGKSAYTYIGPVIFPLIGLTLVYLFVTSRLASGVSLPAFYNSLRIVEVVAPALGFLGTTISLLNVMGQIDPSQSQGDMLKTLMTNSASAFGSTVYGITLSILAYVTREIFEKFIDGGADA